jgi:predicted ATPase
MNPAETGSNRAPARLGSYVIERELGRGGMGVVYLGLDPRLSRQVAIKVLSRQFMNHPDLRRRFEREARLLAAVNHPNVVTIHSIEETAGEILFVIEFLAGAGLDERLAQGRMSVEEAVRLGTQVAAALEAAHAQGVIHRDLKPANVKASASGTWKVLDFGLARPMRDVAGPGLTLVGEIMGTPGYMSPEQLRGEELDAATDTWALGCLLFECLSGTRAFDGGNFVERAAAILASEPDWKALPSGLPAPLVRLLRTLLDKNRGARLGDAAKVRGTLESLFREQGALPATVASARPASPIPQSLPAERDEFVGRSAEMEALARRLAAGERLVTILGMGGTGKTRFVARYGWNHQGDWPGGIFFCDLSVARDLEGIVSAVAGVLDVPLGNDDPIAQLGRSIAGRGKCLVIFDNFEQVTEHAPATVGRWLSRAADASLVVTSREILGIPGEHVMALPPLPLESAGVELFVVRAQARHQGFELTGINEGPVREIVKLLDGLPLAIELAAARTRMLSPEQLLARLTDRFQLLVGGRDVQARQSTLRSAIDWSWMLLAPWEQAALAQASVFVGGFTLEAAESVLDLSAWAAAPIAMDVVQSLGDKSLLRSWMPEGSNRLVTVGPYFGMYMSVQEYAAEKLRTVGALPNGASGTGAEIAAQERHGRYYAAYGSEEALDALDMHGGMAHRQALALERENILAACERALGRGDGETAVATFEAAWSVLALKGPFPPAVELGKHVLDLRLGPADRGRAACLLAEALQSAGRLEEALPNYQEAIALAREVGDRRREGIALASLGVLNGVRGRVEEGAVALEMALGLAREDGNRCREGITLGNLATLHSNQGRMEEALRNCQEALAIHREVGNRRGEGLVLGNLGVLRFNQGRMEEALLNYREALAIHREVGNRRYEGFVLGSMGSLHAAQDRMEEALRHLQEALAIHREAGNRRLEGAVLGNLGIVHMEQGRMEEALRHLQEALAIHREVGHRRLEGVALGSLGALYSRQGRFGEARAALTTGEALLRDVDERQLGVLLCIHGECERLAGDLPAARRQLADAESIAQKLVASPDSELGKEVAKLRAALDRSSELPRDGSAG